MGTRAHQKKIKEAVWTVNSYSTSKGIRLTQTLLSIAGESIGALIDKSNQAKGDATLLDAEFSELIAKAIKNLKEHDLNELLKDIINHPLKDNKEIDYDSEFAENYGALVELVKFCLQVNFSSFFPASGS